jgi:hypothetical protein
VADLDKQVQPRSAPEFTHTRTRAQGGSYGLYLQAPDLRPATRVDRLFGEWTILGDTLPGGSGLPRRLELRRTPETSAHSE